MWCVEVVLCHYSVLLMWMRLIHSPISVRLCKFCDGADNVVHVLSIRNVWRTLINCITVVGQGYWVSRVLDYEVLTHDFHTDSWDAAFPNHYYIRPHASQEHRSTKRQSSILMVDQATPTHPIKSTDSLEDDGDWRELSRLTITNPTTELYT